MAAVIRQAVVASRALTKQKSPRVNEGKTRQQDMGSLSGKLTAPSHQPMGDTRKRILISTDESVVNDEAIQALTKDETLFHRGGKLVHIVRDSPPDGIERPEGAPRILPIKSASLRERLTAVARFVELVANGGERSAHPPKWCYDAVFARGAWPRFRLLSAVVTAPVLRADGTILSVPGYDARLGLFLDTQGVTFPVVDKPTHKDALKAITKLSDLVADFPFKKPEHLSAWLAFLLTPLARFAFDGPAPLFLFDANVRGSGKTLLCDLVGLIVTGREMPRMTNPESDAEARKRITAVAVNGDSLCLIDNVAGYLGCPSLDAALTATSWKDRLLGKTEMVEFPLQATWSATGNNVILIGDMTRRVCHCRLESPLENPELRDGFAHENLKAYVLQNRSKLLVDALTVLCAYCLAGRPKKPLPPWGTLEGWSDLVRQAIVWCGHPDPGDTRIELVKQSDSEAIALRDIIEGWSELDPDYFGLTSAEIISKLEQNLTQHERIRGAFLELCPTKDARQLPSPNSLGMKLRQLRGRVVSGQFINSRLNRKKSSAWFVDRQTAGDAGLAGGKFHSLTQGNEDNTYRKEHETSPAAPASPAKSPDEQLEF